MLQLVSVTFNELSLKRHTNCSYDSVSLHDGSSANSPSLGRFCTVSISTITSTGSSLFVVFQTDNSYNKGRFSLNWTFGSIGWFIIMFDSCITKATIICAQVVARWLPLV